MPWVLIWRTGAPLAASRRASLSVSRSPTSAAACAPRAAQLAQGQLQQRRLACAGARNQIQHQHAGRSEAIAQPRRKLVVLLQDSPPQLHNPGGHMLLLNLIRRGDLQILSGSGSSISIDFDLQLAPLAKIGRRLAATRAAEALHALDLRIHAAGIAVHDHGQLVDDQRRARKRRAFRGQLPAELQRIFDDRSQRAHAQPHFFHARAGIRGGRLGDRLHNAGRDGKLMHRSVCKILRRRPPAAAGAQRPGSTLGCMAEPSKM